MSDANTHDQEGLTTAELVEQALDKWVEITGVTRDQTRFSMGDFDVHHMNKAMEECSRFDPEGVTTYLLLECFLRDYLERKTFTAAQIMKDYKATSAYLQKAEELFSLVQSERATEMASTFRSRVTEGVRHYGADKEDVIEMINDADTLPFLRRDALYSLNSLKPYQFLSGDYDTSHAQIIEHVYMAWDVNQLLKALRDLPVSGIAVVLMRDPARPDRSYFTFAMRNGGNVVLFTDKTKPAYPGQEDRLDQRGGRGIGRRFQSREWENHFPYQLIPRSYNEDGDVIFEKEKSPVQAGLDLVPLMKISDLPPHQVIWLTMMLSLISDKFWKKKWGAEQLSYTGAMVRMKSLLVTDESGNNLPVAQGYVPITLEEVEVDEVTAEAMSDQIKGVQGGVNSWLEARYRNRIPKEVVNQWFSEGDMQLMLPRTPEKGKPNRKGDEAGTEVAPGVLSISKKEIERMPFWDQPTGYALQTFSSSEFGTEAELQKDRLFIARYNMAKHIQKSADDEYQERKEEIAKWYKKAVRKNLSGLHRLIAAAPLDGWDHNSMLYSKGEQIALTIGPIKDDGWSYHYSNRNMIGTMNAYGSKYQCYVTDAVATYRVRFVPNTAAQLALLCGCEISALPDVLQHYNKNARHVGNHLLNRLDPVETDIHDPWKDLDLVVCMYLSKRALTKIEKGQI